MRRFQTLTSFVLAAALISPALAGPEQDLQAFRDHFAKRFPKLELSAYQNGVYAVDATSRAEWEMIEEFPPYEPYVAQGETLWQTPFANGKRYADCFPEGPGVAHTYPRWDESRESVVTLAMAVNECRTANGEAPLPWMRGPMASVLAYMAFESRGKPTSVAAPSSPKALAAYESGKSYFYARRGQLNFSCAQCHVDFAGAKVRSDIISPALGHTTGWPVYRSAWGELGTLHRRFSGCNQMTRARTYPAQSEPYRNLEYFLTYMSNGVEMNGPSSRK